MINRCRYFWLLVLIPSIFAATLLDGTAAIVDKQVISYHEVNQRIDALKKRLSSQSLSHSQLAAIALNQAIDQTVLEQWLTATGQSITQQAIQQQRQQYKKQGHSPLPTHQAIKEGLIIHQAQQAVLQTTNGFPSQIQLKQWLEKHQDSKQRYQLFPWHRQQKQAAVALKKRLLATPSLRPDDATPSWQPASSYPDVFRQALVQSTDRIIGPIQTENGYYVLQIIQREGKPLTINDAFQSLVDAHLAREWPKWLESIKAHHYIKRFTLPTA